MKYGAIEMTAIIIIIVIIVIDIIAVIITTPLHLVGSVPESKACRKRSGKPGL